MTAGKQQSIVRSGVAGELARYLRQHGAGVKPLLSEVGLGDVEDLDNPLAAVSLEAVVRMFDLAAKQTGHPDLALRFTASYRGQSGGLYGDILRSAATVGGMLQAAASFMPVFAIPVRAELKSANGVGKFSWAFPDDVRAPRMQFNIFIAAAVVSRIRFSADPKWMPRLVEFEHIAPDCMPEMLEYFGPRQMFDAGINRVTVEASVLSRPLVTANPSRYVLLTDLARRWIDELRVETDALGDTQRAIQSLLGEGRADLDAVAAATGMTARALQWRLGRAGTTFERVLSEERRLTAERLLLNTDRSLTDISLDLGFSSPSAFSRASQRWFGMSPRQFRVHLRERGGARSRRTS